MGLLIAFGNQVSICSRGWGLWLRGLRLADRGSTMGWQRGRTVVLFGLGNYFSFAELPVAHARSALRNERTVSFPKRHSLIISEFGKNVCNADR